MVSGFRRGLLVEVFSLIAFLFGLFIALEFTIPVSLALFGATGFLDVGAIVVFILLFILLVISINVAVKAVKKAIDFTLLGTLDNILGSFAGLLKTALIISIILWIFDSVGFRIVENYSSDTTVLPYIVGLGPTVFEWVSGLIPLVRDLIDSMESLSDNEDSITCLGSLYLIYA